MKKTFSLFLALILACTCLLPSALGKEDDTPSALEVTTAWRNSHGYSFMIYGATYADLTPISDYLSLLAENKIYIDLPDLLISNKEDYDWISSNISAYFWLRYVSYHDNSKYSFTMEVPTSYRPRNEVLTYLMVSVLGIEYDEAAELLNTLQYNVIDGSSSIKNDAYELFYDEYGSYDGFMALEVVKFLQPQK